MLRHSGTLWVVLVAVALGITFAGVLVYPGLASNRMPGTHKVIVPEADRFNRFAITIHRGDVVKWVNKDTDDHTIVSDDAVNTAGNSNTNHLLVGTDNNGGQPGKFELTFTQTGTFVYYCRFHSQLDAFHQPIAPGPEGGIDGTPMMGVITVVP